MSRAPISVAPLVVALALVLPACLGEGSLEGQQPLPLATQAPPTGVRVAARFEGILQQIAALRGLAQRGASPPLWAGTRGVIDQGIALIRARMPHDLKRPDVLRYTAARSAFGEALKEVTYARDAQDPVALDQALQRLDGTARRWSDVYLGLPPESSI